MSKTTWMVRAGRGGELVDRYREKSHVGMGHGGESMGPLPYDQLSKVELQNGLTRLFPGWKPKKIQNAASQLYRFFHEVSEGDGVVTYDPGQREYLLGTIVGGLQYLDGEVLPYVRNVRWRGKVARDGLSPQARNTLGSILTLFRLQDDVAQELEAGIVPLDAPPRIAQPVDRGPKDGEDLAAVEDPSERARELIDDRINALDWEELQELVAGLLRAMGYKTRVSPKGADRGVDIFASPDGLGLQEPRIFVEVKHRGQAMSAPDIRTFLGGRQQSDRCLYVSTGGFTKDARYEAERSTVPIMIVDLPALRDLLLDHYDRADEQVRILIPLTKIYWPLPDED